MLGLKEYLEKKLGLNKINYKVYGDDLIKSVNLFYFYKYLNKLYRNLLNDVKEIFDICNICKNNFNLTEELNK